MKRAGRAVAAAGRRAWRWAVASIDITDILTAIGILAVGVWIADLYGWPAAVGFAGVCLLALGIGGAVLSAVLSATVVKRR